MSTSYAITSSPTLILQGFQFQPTTVVNTGSSTVYVADTSSVSVGSDMALGVGASLQVDAGQTLWAVCASGQSSLLGVLPLYGQRFEYAQPVGTLLTSQSNGAAFTFTPDDAVASNFASVLVVLTPPSGTGVGGTLEAYCSQVTAGITLPNSEPYSGGIMGAAWPNSSSGAGHGSYWAVFPVTAYGFTVWAISTDGGTVPPMSVYGLRTSVPGTIVGGQGFTVITPTTGLTDYRAQLGNTYTVAVPSVSASLTSAALRLPTVPGPVRVAVQGTQVGAGALTCQLAVWERTAAAGTPPVTSTAWVPFDTAAISSTTAGAKFASAQYGVWPTAPMALLVTTAAGVTMTNLVVSIHAGGQ